MDRDVDADPGPEPRHPYLEALLAAQVPADRVIQEAERLGWGPEELLRLADQLVEGRPGGTRMAALALALGAAEHWRPFLAGSLAFGIDLFEPLVRPMCSDLDPLARVLGDGDWDGFCARVLERLGHPPLAGRDAAVAPWLDRDLGLVLDALDLAGFRSRAQAWSRVLVDRLVLRDGAGPRRLGLGAGDRWDRAEPGCATRLFRVGRLRVLDGLAALATLVAVDCPELERLDAAPAALVLKGCPGLRAVPAHPRGLLLHLEDCPRLRAIDFAAQGEAEAEPESEPRPPSPLNVILAGCGALRELPSRLQVGGRLRFRRMGPIHRWPQDFSIGGDFTVEDCPLLEELPPLEVAGDLRVTGESGLRRLAAGTTVGGTLDLRACRLLAALPRGVQVGGALLLPAHLEPPRFQPAQALLEWPADRYPALRSLLLGLAFPELVRAGERLAARERAEAALAGLRRDLLEQPRIEPDLLWTASEAWRDLAAERWAERHPWEASGEADDDLPMAWFRQLVYATVDVAWAG